MDVATLRCLSPLNDRASTSGDGHLFGSVASLVRNVAPWPKDNLVMRVAPCRRTASQSPRPVRLLLGDVPARRDDRLPGTQRPLTGGPIAVPYALLVSAQMRAALVRG